MLNRYGTGVVSKDLHKNSASNSTYIFSLYIYVLYAISVFSINQAFVMRYESFLGDIPVVIQIEHKPNKDIIKQGLPLIHIYMHTQI